MEGRGPYRIYDPGGSREEPWLGDTPPQQNRAVYQQLLEENAALKERVKGLQSLGDLLEESQTEALKLRQKVEELVRDNKVLTIPPSLERPIPGVSTAAPSERRGSEKNSSCIVAKKTEAAAEGLLKTDQKPPSSGTSSEFEVVNVESSLGEEKKLQAIQKQTVEGSNPSLHLQSLESMLNVYAEESDKNQFFAQLGRMALEFNRLSSKVQENEQKTAILQTLCEELRKENEALRKKLVADLEHKSQTMESLRQENVELKKRVARQQVEESPCGADFEVVTKEEVKSERACSQQSSKATEKQTDRSKDTVEVYEKKIKALEHQRIELLDVNKQWDQQFRSMKQQYEKKITELRQRLADSQKVVVDLEAEREQKQRDFDRKLLLAKSKIETEEAEKERVLSELEELAQRNKFLMDQLTPLTKQREYQEKEIQRLNKALEEALSLQASAPQASLFLNCGESGKPLRRQELLTQIEVLKQQVKIFEEDFQKERSDRERMNEEKEELKEQLEKLQTQVTVLGTQGQGEKRPPDLAPGELGPTCPSYRLPYGPLMPHHVYQGYMDWQRHYPPVPAPPDQTQIPDFHHFSPVDFTWRPPYPSPGSRTVQGGNVVNSKSKDSEPLSPVLNRTQR
ncbi:TNFAIP3-interacting protein 1 isoform X2 [Latimeria chalumnae]|uniref:TNFAIP3-interacting protein 1 isoform X2 n=1 Tax=Latimeria chalumnae TaxID=7897 RepID=UPI00313B75D3